MIPKSSALGLLNYIEVPLGISNSLFKPKDKYMKIKFNKTYGSMTSKGLTFTASGEYEVSKEIADYLVSSFPANFSVINALKVEAKEEPKVETKSEAKSEPKAKLK